MCANDFPIKIFQCIFYTNKLYTLESLARELYISRSKLYKIIKNINQNMEKYGSKILLQSQIGFKGEKYFLLSLLFEMKIQLGVSMKSRDCISYHYAKRILNCFKIKINAMSLGYYQTWLETFLDFKKIEQRKGIVLFEEENSQINTEILKNNHSFMKEVELFSNHFSNSVYNSFESFALYLGIFYSTVDIDNPKASMHFMQQHMMMMNTRCIDEVEDELLTLFEMYYPENEKPMFLRYSLQVIFSNYHFHKLRYTEFLYTQNSSYCPREIRMKIIKLPKLKKLFEENNFDKEDINILVEFIWYVCKTSEYSLKHLGKNKKIVFKSIFGEKNEKRMKQRVLEKIFMADSYMNESDDVFWIVDDERLLKDSNSMSIDKFVERLDYFLSD